MSDNIKAVAVITSGLVCFGFGVVGAIYEQEILMNLCYAFGSVFGALIGFPIIGRAIQKLAK